jgi:hypothetical protein
MDDGAMKTVAGVVTVLLSREVHQARISRPRSPVLEDLRTSEVMVFLKPTPPTAGR